MFGKMIRYLIVLIVLVGTSCSSLRVTKTGGEEGIYNINSRRLLKAVEENNIINGPLVINKIIIKYRQGEENRRVRAYLRYNGADSILVSLRTFAGIEAARILVVKDSVWVIDKINRYVYQGNNKELEKKYGVNYEMIKMIFGDLDRVTANERRLVCRQNKTNIREENGDEIREYIIDCVLFKMTEIRGYVKDDTDIYRGDFEDFKNIEGLVYPERIKWSLNDSEITLDITMSNVRRRDKVNVNFIVPENYKKGKI